jgi:phospholipase C
MDIATFREHIEHVVILMMENRSYDHVLGSLTLHENRTDLDGLREEMHTNSDASGHMHEIHSLAARFPKRVFRFPHDPPHDYEAVEGQVRSGMAGFIKEQQAKHPGDQNPESVMGYLTRAEQPVTYFLADNFVVCDKFYSAVPGHTLPNRFYGLGGTSLGFKKNPGATDLFIDLPTIFSKMDSKDWYLYADNPTTLHMLDSLLSALKVHKSKRRINQLEKDVKAGKLPKVSWIAPRFSWTDGVWANLAWKGPADDDHPPSDIRLGQALIRNVYDAISQTHDTWKKTLLIITYDEHGGFYDHVKPPALADDERIEGDYFKRRGVRVPAILVSPYTRTTGPDRVCSEPMDHCSVLKLLCDWLEIAPWTPRIETPHIKSVAAGIPAAVPDEIPAAPDAPDPPMPSPLEAAEPVHRERDDNDRLYDDLHDKMVERFGDLEDFGFGP